LFERAVAGVAVALQQGFDGLHIVRPGNGTDWKKGEEHTGDAKREDSWRGWSFHRREFQVLRPGEGAVAAGRAEAGSSADPQSLRGTLLALKSLPLCM